MLIFDNDRITGASTPFETRDGTGKNPGVAAADRTGFAGMQGQCGSHVSL